CSFTCISFHLVLNSFPTRRSSDLNTVLAEYVATSSIDDIKTDSLRETIANAKDLRTAMIDVGRPLDATNAVSKALHATICSRSRSEEHTSELQSRENLVCRLLLEK